MLIFPKILSKGGRNRVKRIGPSTEPCETPRLAIVLEEELTLTWTNSYLSDKYDLNYF